MLAAVLQHALLPRDLVLDRLLHETKGVDVLELGARAELFLPHRSDRHVRVAAKRALFEVAIVHTDEHQNVAKLAQVGLGFVGAPQVRLADDLDERRAAAVEVDERHCARAGAVDVLRRVLFDVNACNANRAWSRRRPRCRDDLLPFRGSSNCEI